jgi:hypothetical protein
MKRQHLGGWSATDEKTGTTSQHVPQGMGLVEVPISHKERITITLQELLIS